jgi:hypothetical protein
MGVNPNLDLIGTLSWLSPINKTFVLLTHS